MRKTSARHAAATTLLVLVAIAGCSLWTSSESRASGFAAPRGSVWVKAAYSRWGADKRFAGIFDRDPSSGVAVGDEVPFDRAVGGEVDSQSLTLDVSATPIERLWLAVTFPVWQSTRFTDSTFTSTTTGTGDIFARAGYQVTPTSVHDVGTSLILHVKYPTTTLPDRIDGIPLSEGQVDVAIEQRTTFVLLPGLHLTTKLLGRLRLPFQDGDREIKPGDELEIGAEVGGAPVGRVWLVGGIESLWSTGGEDSSGAGIVSVRDKRQVHEAFAGAYVTWGGWVLPALDQLALDASIRRPVAGRDYPVGFAWSVGLAFAHEF